MKPRKKYGFADFVNPHRSVTVSSLPTRRGELLPNGFYVGERAYWIDYDGRRMYGTVVARHPTSEAVNSLNPSTTVICKWDYEPDRYGWCTTLSMYHDNASPTVLSHGFYVGQRVYYDSHSLDRRIYGTVVDHHTDNLVILRQNPVWALWEGGSRPTYVAANRVRSEDYVAEGF